MPRPALVVVGCWGDPATGATSALGARTRPQRHAPVTLLDLIVGRGSGQFASPTHTCEGMAAVDPLPGLPARHANAAAGSSGPEGPRITAVLKGIVASPDALHCTLPQATRGSERGRPIGLASQSALDLPGGSMKAALLGLPVLRCFGRCGVCEPSVTGLCRGLGRCAAAQQQAAGAQRGTRRRPTGVAMCFPPARVPLACHCVACLQGGEVVARQQLGWWVDGAPCARHAASNTSAGGGGGCRPWPAVTSHPMQRQQPEQQQ